MSGGASPTAAAMRRRLRAAAARVPHARQAARVLRALAAVPRAWDPEQPSPEPPPYPGSARFLAWQPPGHFYSPVPDWDEIERDADRLFSRPSSLPSIDLHEDEQVALFAELAALAREVPAPGKGPGRFAPNDSYGIGDATVLQSMLRRLRPKRYVEVGSGWTTALAADTNDTFLDGSMEMVTIDPYPELVRRLLPSAGVKIVGTRVQDAPMAVFEQLEAGDVLFIDSSHVDKPGSDVHYLYTRVLPRLPAGVHVHIHDIFWPFDYIRGWLEEGRAWNEAHLLHAFLLFNERFRIEFFCDWFVFIHGAEIERLLPAILENTGGAIWLVVDDVPGSARAPVGDAEGH